MIALYCAGGVLPNTSFGAKCRAYEKVFEEQVFKELKMAALATTILAAGIIITALMLNRFNDLEPKLLHKLVPISIAATAGLIFALWIIRTVCHYQEKERESRQLVPLLDVVIEAAKAGEWGGLALVLRNQGDSVLLSLLPKLGTAKIDESLQIEIVNTLLKEEQNYRLAERLFVRYPTSIAPIIYFLGLEEKDVKKMPVRLNWIAALTPHVQNGSFNPMDSEKGKSILKAIARDYISRFFPFGTTITRAPTAKEWKAFLQICPAEFLAEALEDSGEWSLSDFYYGVTFAALHMARGYHDAFFDESTAKADRFRLVILKTILSQTLQREGFSYPHLAYFASDSSLLSNALTESLLTRPVVQSKTKVDSRLPLFDFIFAIYQHMNPDNQRRFNEAFTSDDYAHFRAALQEYLSKKS